MKKQRNDSVRGYRFDFSSNTLYLDKRFSAAAARDFLSPEAIRLREIMEIFPHISVVTRAGREITKARPTKRLSYKNMELYIEAKAPAYLEEFELQKKLSAPQKSPYKYVRDWFESTFEDYKSSDIFKGDDEEKDREKRDPSPTPIPNNPPQIDSIEQLPKAANY